MWKLYFQYGNVKPEFLGKFETLLKARETVLSEIETLNEMCVNCYAVNVDALVKDVEYLHNYKYTNSGALFKLDENTSDQRVGILSVFSGGYPCEYYTLNDKFDLPEGYVDEP